MRILVYPSSTDMGGSQTNAIELAEQMHRRGHHVVVFGPPGGVLVDRIVASGMPFEPAPARPRVRPSPRTMSALIATATRHRVDIVHGYEWPPIMEAFYGPFLRKGIIPVGTVMSMGVAPFIPRGPALIVGTAKIASIERDKRPNISVIEPPVDLAANHPTPASAEVRRSVGAEGETLLVVVVGRLAKELKREGLIDAVRAVGRLSATRSIRLAVVGEGPARADVEQAVRELGAAGAVVTLVGEVSDPRPWYAAADVTIGMGGSALRAMAFGKPLLVQGEGGFWRLLTPDSLGTFLEQGWYGVADGVDGSRVLAQLLDQLCEDPARRAELGEFALSVVTSRFGLEAAGTRQEEIYRKALAFPPSRWGAMPGAAWRGAQVTSYELRRRYRRWRGTGSGDDFNTIAAQRATPRRRP